MKNLFRKQDREATKMLQDYGDRVREGKTHPDAAYLERFFLRDETLEASVREEIKKHLSDCLRCQALRKRYAENQSWFANRGEPCD